MGVLENMSKWRRPGCTHVLFGYANICTVYYIYIYITLHTISVRYISTAQSLPRICIVQTIPWDAFLLIFFPAYIQVAITIKC